MDNQIFDYIKASKFFPKYTRIKKWNWKLKGIDEGGKELSFSDKEKEEIKKGLRRLFGDIIKKPTL